MTILERTDIGARVVQGAAAAVVAAAANLAVLSVGGPATLSRTQTLLMFPVCAGGGAVAGTVYYATESLRRRGGWRKTAVNVVTLLSFCAAVLVLGGLAAWAGLLRE